MNPSVLVEPHTRPPAGPQSAPGPNAPDPSAARPNAHDFLEAYETAQVKHGNARLEDHLPPPGDPLRAELLPELIRIDMEYGWERGRPLPLDEYRRRYPEPFADPDQLGELAFEEYRLRMQAGECTSPAEYAQRYGIATDDWPVVAATIVTPAGTPAGGIEDLIKAASAYQQRTRHRAHRRCAAGAPGELFDELHRADPAQAERLAEAVITMPQAGDEFLDFRLIAELGRGAFGRVFLAEQQDLAGRRVALKISADLQGETQTLAQLLHTNVMPIYSVHRVGPFQAACMPYYGSTTLADVLRAYKDVAVPVSGRDLITTLKNPKTVVSQTRSGAALPSSAGGRDSHGADSDGVILPRPNVGSRVILDKLERGTYVEAMLWIASRLADGLAHAHERGILHRDLKPANILLSGEGQPLLLDFNLAEDVKLRGAAAAARLGGTLPYMSPEQLRAMQGEQVELDARSDIYALGLILYELLTGSAPWTVPGGPVRMVVAGMVEARRQLPSGLRARNPAVSPATEAIVLKCLHPDPACRYQTARELQEDLEDQLHHQKLRHTPEPSWRERRRKFARRHPRLCSSVVIGTTAALLLLGAAGLVAFQAHRLKQQAVLDQFHAFQDDVRTVQLLLTAQNAERTPWEEALARGKQALDPYKVLDDEGWRQGDGVRYLPAAEQERLREEIGTVLFMMTRAEILRPGSDGSDDRAASLRTALHWSRLAEGCFGPRPPASIWDQRVEVLRRLGQLDEAERVSALAKNERPASTRDKVMTAREHVAQGRFRQAFPLLRDATQEDPQNLMAWFLLARCHDDLGQDAQALACYNTCLALWPRQHRLYFNRGLAHLRLRDYARAAADFDRCIALDPNHHDAYFNRGLARQGLNKHAEAIDDYTAALDLGAPFTRIYFVRARAREKVNDLDGARRDRADGLRLQPTDERSWVARGVARISTEPARALEDFDEALKMNPRYRPALDNKAHVLAELLGKTAEAIRVLDRIIELYPDHVVARSSRGVLWARLKKRSEALHDAEEALIRSAGPAIQYQVAGIYALTSRTDPDDAREAFRLLSAALRRGYGLDYVGRDTDLDPIRNRPEFRRLVEAARALQAQAGG
ncbi:MAG: tetratricopeptide repeat protein [Gemmataceae bacterium]|nr:tetratricopeptide repeat protein [Gemmataceae bacterium]